MSCSDDPRKNKIVPRVLMTATNQGIHMICRFINYARMKIQTRYSIGVVQELLNRAMLNTVTADLDNGQLAMFITTKHTDMPPLLLSQLPEKGKQPTGAITEYEIPATKPSQRFLRHRPQFHSHC